jgi:GTP-binding protein YchF
MKVGLVGFSSSGKTTVYNALSGQRAETGYASRGSGKTNLGVVKVPDSRVEALAAIHNPKKVTFAEIVFVDVAAPPGAGGRSLDASALPAMREVEALVQVVRAFPTEDGHAPDPLGELSDLHSELTLGDLSPVEKRLERLKKEKGKPGEVELLTRIKEHLEAGKALRDLPLSEQDLVNISGYRFLTSKPLLIVLNLAEDAVSRPVPDDVQSYAKKNNFTVIPLSGKLEMELAELPPDEQKAFLADLGLAEPALFRFVRAAYASLDLISFLTAGPDECRAWTIKRGTSAHRAAGKIHSDIERGFIRAEVMTFEDFMLYKSEAKVREAGKARLEGKEYIVRDGDIIHFRHSS